MTKAHRYEPLINRSDQDMASHYGTAILPARAGKPRDKAEGRGRRADRGALDRGPMATAEPKTLRYRLLHTAARVVRGQRKRKIRIPETWPWATQLAEAMSAALTPTSESPSPT